MRRRRPLRSQLGAAASSGGCALLRGMFRAAHSIVLLGSPLLLLTMALAAVAAVASAVVAPPADDPTLAQRRLPYDAKVTEAGPRRVHVLEEYLLAFHGRTPEYKLIEASACVCGAQMVLNETLHMEVCTDPACGELRRRRDTTVGSTGFAAPGESNSHDFKVFVYSRCAYVEHLLRSLAARTNQQVPDRVLEDVGAELGGEAATPEAVERAMRKLTRQRNAARRRGEKAAGPSLQRWYECSALVASKLDGSPPFRLSRELEAELVRRFRMASEAFDRIAQEQHGVSTARKNMCAYNFSLRRIAAHMLEDGHEPMRRFLREVLTSEGRDRRSVNRTLWSRICEMVGWPDNSGPLAL